MPRAHFSRPVQDASGDVQLNAVVRVLQPGTTTPITDTIYAAATGGTTRTNPFTYTDGVISFYLDTPQQVRLGVTIGAAPEVFFDDVDVDAAVPMTPFTMTVTIPGTAIVRTGTMRQYLEYDGVISTIRISAGTPPAGASLLVDIKKNGTSILAAPAGLSSGSSVATITPTTTTFSAGDYFTLDVTQVGSTTPGSEVAVSLTVTAV